MCQCPAVRSTLSCCQSTTPPADKPQHECLREDVLHAGASKLDRHALCHVHTARHLREVKAKLDFSDEVWAGVPRLAKEFLAGTLHRSIRQRWTATQALHHPWLHGEEDFSPLPYTPSSLAMVSLHCCYSLAQVCMTVKSAELESATQQAGLHLSLALLSSLASGCATTCLASKVTVYAVQPRACRKPCDKQSTLRSGLC